MNAPLTPEGIREQLRRARQESDFGGVTILPVTETRPKYLSQDYFARFREILEGAATLGLRAVLYDDINFPSGSAGGEMARRYPADLMKRLEKTEREVTGPRRVTLTLPAGDLMSAVAMNTTTRERIDLTKTVAARSLAWDAPAGAWKLMAFTCGPGDYDRVDYLNPESVKKFIHLTYDEYFKRFAKYFGSTIRMSFFDDVSLMYTKGYQTWTPDFNRKFEKKYAFSPAPLYPALWYDIGPETESARVALFGFRAELMAEGYPKMVSLWARAHGIQAAGHPAGNYDPTPVDMGGDDIKFYKNQDIPLLDAIFFHGHGRDGFKMTTSAASLFDRPVTAAEAYGAFAEKTTDPVMLYRVAMELYARGVNFIIPHGMWYDPSNVRIPPLISAYSPKLGPALPGYNRFAGRMSLMLQGGRHVAEIGVLYPIDSLEAFYQFEAPGLKKFGQYVPPECDYQRVGAILTGGVRRDFTFLHPDSLDAQCTVQDASIHLKNKVNFEDYKVIVIPGGRVIHWSNLQKIKDFYDRGGKVIATTQLPIKSAEPGHDADVCAAVRAIFGIAPAPPPPLPYHVKIEAIGKTIRTFVNGTLVDVSTDATYKRGRIGLREAPNERATFDNITVTDPRGTRLFYDDFAKGLGQWAGTPGADTADGRLSLSDNQTMLSIAGRDWSDLTIESDMKIVSGNAGIVFRAADENNQYMWQFGAGATLRTHKKTRGGWALLKRVSFGALLTAPVHTQRNAAGGLACFTTQPSLQNMTEMLDAALPLPDVALEGSVAATSGNGMLSYIHKVKEGADLYYFANSSDDTIDTWARLRGKLTPELWDPHSGAIGPAQFEWIKSGEENVTRVRLKLSPVRSMIVRAVH